jgi:hypothetical protein
MKGLIINGLSALMLSAAIAPATIAQTPAPAPATQPMQVTVQTEPTDLAYLAYRGYLSGIPSGDRFIDELVSGRLMAKDIVEQAISEHRVTEDTRMNATYLSALQGELDQFPRFNY